MRRLFEGLLLTGPTPSSLIQKIFLLVDNLVLQKKIVEKKKNISMCRENINKNSFRFIASSNLMDPYANWQGPMNSAKVCIFNYIFTPHVLFVMIFF